MIKYNRRTVEIENNQNQNQENQNQENQNQENQNEENQNQKKWKLKSQSWKFSKVRFLSKLIFLKKILSLIHTYTWTHKKIKQACMHMTKLCEASQQSVAVLSLHHVSSR